MKQPWETDGEDWNGGESYDFRHDFDDRPASSKDKNWKKGSKKPQPMNPKKRPQFFLRVKNQLHHVFSDHYPENNPEASQIYDRVWLVLEGILGTMTNVGPNAMNRIMDDLEQVEGLSASVRHEVLGVLFKNMPRMPRSRVEVAIKVGENEGQFEQVFASACLAILMEECPPEDQAAMRQIHTALFSQYFPFQWEKEERSLSGFVQAVSRSSVIPEKQKQAIIKLAWNSYQDDDPGFKKACLQNGAELDGPAAEIKLQVQVMREQAREQWRTYLRSDRRAFKNTPHWYEVYSYCEALFTDDALQQDPVISVIAVRNRLRGFDLSENYIEGLLSVFDEYNENIVTINYDLRR